MFLTISFSETSVISFFFRTFAFLCLLSAFTSAPAGASDQDVSRHDWTGFYVGTFAAGGRGTTEAAFGDMHPTGVFGGVDMGLQYQLDNLVLGIEANASLSDLDDDKGSGVTAQSQDMDNIASVRAKLGASVGERSMIFATAGWGWGQSEYGEGLVQQKKDISGPALGVGGHYALNNHFIGRLEYVHYFYGNTTYDIPAPVMVKNSADELRIGLDYKF